MKKFRIVIVENDEDERHFMQTAFAESGRFEVLAAMPNGDELLEWLDKTTDARPSLVLSDLNMPGKNGYDILQEFRDRGLQIPLVITSTSTAFAVRQKSLDLGALAYLVKPDTFIDYGPFADELHSVLEEKGVG